MSLHEIKGIGGEIQVGMPYIGYTKNNEIFKTSPVVEYRRDNNGVYIQTDNGNVYASGNYYKALVEQNIELNQRQGPPYYQDNTAKTEMAKHMLDHVVNGKNPQFIHSMDSNSVLLIRNGMSYQLNKNMLQETRPGDHIKVNVQVHEGSPKQTLNIPQVNDIKLGADGSLLIASRGSVFTDCHCIKEYNLEVDRFNRQQSLHQEMSMDICGR